MDKFHEMKKDISVALGQLVQHPVENSHQGIHAGLAYALEHGTFEEGAEAVMMVGQWMWAHCEEWYHSSQPATSK